MKKTCIALLTTALLSVFVSSACCHNSSAITIEKLKEKVPSKCSSNPDTWNSGNSIITKISGLRVFGYCGFHLFNGTSNESNSLFYPVFVFNQSACKDCALAPAGINRYPAEDNKVTSGYYNNHSQSGSKYLDSSDVPYYYLPHFMCQQHGSACTKLGTLTSKIYFTSCPKMNNNASNYYWVYITAGDNASGDDTQNIAGYIEQPIYRTLTVLSRDINGNVLDEVTELYPRTSTVRGGSSASITRGDASGTGYTFVEWRDANWNYIGGSSVSAYTISSLTSDTTIYAVYRGENGSSSTNIKVRNNSVSKYNVDNQTVVYAKPGTIEDPVGDSVTYTAYYSAGAQNGTQWKPQYVQIGRDGGWGGACGDNNTSLTLDSLFNNCRGSYNYWNNAFSVTKENFKSGDTKPIDYTGYGVGVTTGETAGKTNDHIVAPQEVGPHALIEHAVTNRGGDGNSVVWSTPKSYSIGLVNGTSGPSSGKVDLTSLDATAEVRVPYNFINEPKKPSKSSDSTKDDDGSDDNVNDVTNEKIVYAGEKDNFDFGINVLPRFNSETNGTYATVVDKAKWRLGLCIGNDCNKSDNDPTKYKYSKEWGGGDGDKLNAEYKLEGDTIDKKNLTINIPDLPAGSRICVVGEVYPKTSGDYLNWNNTNYDGQWARSPKSCYTVAKRPSVQFLGGNVYSMFKIDTAIAVKNNLSGREEEYPYIAEVRDNQPAIAFGSWGELGVVSNGSTRSLGSGASMGYPLGNNNGSDFCNLIPLTIPNDNCGNMGTRSDSSSNQASNDKSSIIELLGGENDVENGTINKDSIAEAGGVSNGVTKVITHEGNITISDDLEYFTGLYQKYSEMPKLVIYAKAGDIYIDCKVKRIDALLIADKSVVTCNNFGENLTVDNVKQHINDSKNSDQLTINGAIIASRLIANRTYGAATGENSIVPAEIVNFDPTLYQFGNAIESDDDTTGRLDISTIYEIAPRL